MTEPVRCKCGRFCQAEAAEECDQQSSPEETGQNYERLFVCWAFESEDEDRSQTDQLIDLVGAVVAVGIVFGLLWVIGWVMEVVEVVNP